ncbi:hypothetical protein Hanom_Chr15g01367301 [Helianthus anomalus]
MLYTNQGQFDFVIFVVHKHIELDITSEVTLRKHHDRHKCKTGNLNPIQERLMTVSYLFCLCGNFYGLFYEIKPHIYEIE